MTLKWDVDVRGRLTGLYRPRTANEAAWTCTAVMLCATYGSPPTHHVWRDTFDCDADSRAVLESIIADMLPLQHPLRDFGCMAYEACHRLYERLAHAERTQADVDEADPRQLTLFGGAL